MGTVFSWQGAYHAAMLETDNRLLGQRIRDAQVAIGCQSLKYASTGQSFNLDEKLTAGTRKNPVLSR
jgi:hypothetical protein